MPTIRQQIIDTIREKLKGAGKPDDLTVVKRNAIPAEGMDLPRVAVSRVAENSNPARPGGRSSVWERHLEIRLDWWVLADDPEDALEPLLAWGSKALMADPGLDRLAIETSETGTDWDVEDVGDDSLGHAIQRFTIRYATKTNDQESKQ